jgi:hypothetical protein
MVKEVTRWSLSLTNLRSDGNQRPVTVLRDGQVIGTRPAKEMTRNDRSK